MHQILEQVIGAHYVGPVPDVLSPEAGRQKMVLDLCTGNGRWYAKHLQIHPRQITLLVDRVMDMAREFPRVQFRGIDIGDIASRVIANRLNNANPNTQT